MYSILRLFFVLAILLSGAKGAFSQNTLAPQPFPDNVEYIGQRSVQHTSYITPNFPNVSYVADSYVYHKLDVYIPTSAPALSPCIIFIHGGGWYKGEKGHSLPSTLFPGQPTYCDSLFAHGYVIADINYRLTQDSIFPAAIYDCKTAIRFLKKHAAQYKIDTCRIGVMGGSAGGHLAVFMGTSIGIDSLEGYHLGSRGVSSSLHAVMDLWGATDFNYFWGKYPSTKPDSCSPYPDSTNAYYLFPQNWLGCNSLGGSPAKVKKANPITYINGNEPPFVIWHGTLDCVVPPIQSQLLYDALRSKGEDVALHYVPHGNHGITNVFPAQDTIRQFFDAKLLNPSFSCHLHSGILEPGTEEAFEIYPNPSSGSFHILSQELQTKSLEVYNVWGAKIFSEVMTEKMVDVDFNISSEPEGIYFVRIYTNKSPITRKLILRK